MATSWCTDSVICSVTNGVFTADSVCAHAVSSFIRKYFSQHISIKSTQTWYMYSFMAQAARLLLKEEESDFQVLQYA